MLSWTELTEEEVGIIRDQKGEFISSCNHKQEEMNGDKKPEAEVEIIRDWKGESISSCNQKQKEMNGDKKSEKKLKP